jgi:hypothetical protein
VVNGGALDSSCFLVLGDPDYTPYPVALGAFRVVAHVDYFFVSPFFLLFANTFLPDFFLCVQVMRTDDLHLLQFLTNPALNEHIDIYLLVGYSFEKNQLFGRVSPEDKRNSSHITRVTTI